MDRARMRFTSPPILSRKPAGESEQVGDEPACPRWQAPFFRSTQGAGSIGLAALSCILLVLLLGYVLREPALFSPAAAGTALGLFAACAAWITVSARHRRALQQASDRARAAEEQAARLAAAYDATLESWVHALSLHDRDSEIHVQRVTELAVRLAIRMGLSEPEVSHLRRGALLHDVGKITIPDSVLRKSGRLTDAEWEMVRQHPAAGYAMLQHIEYLRPALDVVASHHERWDGGGYPGGLKGEEIPLAARIFALADVWDALCTDQPYRAAWPEEAIRTYIAQQAGTQFDPSIAAVFFDMMGEG